VTTLVTKIKVVHRALKQAGVPHAFGGALALAFHTGEPRATRDIDVNIFLPHSEALRGVRGLPAEVPWQPDDIVEVERTGQVRLFWDETPIDLFFSVHAFHDGAALRALEVPFAGDQLPVLDASDLAVFKAFFDRTKDWADVEAMLTAGTVDVPAVIQWLEQLLGPGDSRTRRFRQTVAEHG
jgi:hypothetical protein